MKVWAAIWGTGSLKGSQITGTFIVEITRIKHCDPRFLLTSTALCLVKQQQSKLCVVDRAFAALTESILGSKTWKCLRCAPLLPRALFLSHGSVSSCRLVEKKFSKAQLKCAMNVNYTCIDVCWRETLKTEHVFVQRSHIKETLGVKLKSGEAVYQV